MGKEEQGSSPLDLELVKVEGKKGVLGGGIKLSFLI